MHPVAYYSPVNISKEVIYTDECIQVSAVNYGSKNEPAFKDLKHITAFLKNNTYFNFKCIHAMLLKWILITFCLVSCFYYILENPR